MVVGEPSDQGVPARRPRDRAPRASATCWRPRTTSWSSVRRAPRTRRCDASPRSIPTSRCSTFVSHDGNGVEACREIRSRHPRTACLILTSFADDEALFEAIMAGAAGYVLKQIRSIDLVDAVRRVAAGQNSARPGRHGAGPRTVAPRARGGRADRPTHRPGTPGPRPARRRADQPPDRRRACSWPRRRSRTT